MIELVRLLVLVGVAGVGLVALLTVMLVWEARRPARHTAGWALARGLPCDPGDLGLEYEAWWLDRPSGVRLSVWEVAADGVAEDGEAPTVVMLHGWGQGKVDLLGRLDPWRELCGRIVMYDLRGHGDSEGSLSTLGCGEGEDLLALLERLGEGRFVLAGISMGAVIAMEAGARDGPLRERIAGIVAYGPYGDFHRSVRGRLGAAGYPARPISDLAMVWLRLAGVRHRPTKDAAERLGCPLLVIHGTADGVSPVEHAERLARAAPKAELRLVEGAGHMDMHVVDPSGHAAAVRGFVARLDGEVAARPRAAGKASERG